MPYTNFSKCFTFVIYQILNKNQYIKSLIYVTITKLKTTNLIRCDTDERSKTVTLKMLKNTAETSEVPYKTIKNITRVENE